MSRETSPSMSKLHLVVWFCFLHCKAHLDKPETSHMMHHLEKNSTKINSKGLFALEVRDD